MTPINQGIVTKLTAMAREGNSPAQILHKLVELMPPGKVHKVTLINYMRAAFALTLEQASPIAGWAADNSGELKDSQLNELVAPDILSTRSQWDC